MAPRLRGGASNEEHAPPSVADLDEDEVRRAADAYRVVLGQRKPARAPRRWEYAWVDGEGYTLVEAGPPEDEG